MAAVGGSVESISINGRNFGVAADAEINMKLGGFNNEVEANGDQASARIVKTREPLSLEGVVVEIDDTKGDLEFLQDIADGHSFRPIVISFASGESYQGTAIVTGDLQKASKNTTATLNLMGPGKLTKQ